MNSHHSEIALRSEEEARNARLGYGLRAVAVSVVVGGLAIAVAESMMPAGDHVAAPIMQAPARGTLLAPTAAPDAAPTPREADDPMLNRHEEGVVHHG